MKNTFNRSLFFLFLVSVSNNIYAQTLPYKETKIIERNTDNPDFLSTLELNLPTCFINGKGEAFLEFKEKKDELHLYITTKDGKTHGPLSEGPASYQLQEMEYRPATGEKRAYRVNDAKEGKLSIIMGDGTILTPNKKSNLLFVWNGDGSSYAALKPEYGDGGKVENIELVFGDGKVIKNPKGYAGLNYSTKTTGNKYVYQISRDGSTYVADQDGKEYGPYEKFNVSPQKSGLAALTKQQGEQWGFWLNGVEKKFVKQASNPKGKYFNPNGNSLALSYENDKEETYFLFDNGKISLPVSGSDNELLWNEPKKCWQWSALVGEKRELYIFDSNGGKLGPFSSVDKESEVSTDFNADFSEWFVFYTEGGKRTCLYLDPKSGEIMKHTHSNEEFVHFYYSQDNRMCKLRITDVETTFEYIDNQKVFKTKSFGRPQTSKSGKTMWAYSSLKNKDFRELTFSDGDYYENVFNPVYLEAENKVVFTRVVKDALSNLWMAYVCEKTVE